MKSSHSGSNWRAVYRSWTWESYLNFRKASSKGDSCADLRKQVSCTHIFTHPSLEPTDRHRHQRSKENFNDWKRLVQENTFSLWNLHIRQVLGETPSSPLGNVPENLAQGTDGDERSLLASWSCRAGLEPSILSFFQSQLLVESLLLQG